MPKKLTSIPVNRLSNDFDDGILIAKASAQDLELHEQLKQAHRDDYHLFCLHEEGTTLFEIDFKKYEVTYPAIIYIQPNQVHRVIAVENTKISTWLISYDNLNPAYHRILQEIAPLTPLTINQESLAIFEETISLTIKLFERKQEKLYHAILKDSINALVAIVISQYLSKCQPIDRLSRFESINKAFKTLLERLFSTHKRPAAYAKQLNISTSYLNECVKNATGCPVSFHIQQRVILEAKRLLYHSDKSIKEIAFELGYDDYAYFSRLFTKFTGISASAFRHKNRD